MTFEERLTLQFEDDGDGTGRLVVRATSNGFSGIGGAWFTDKQILEFADALEVFPLSHENYPKLVGGYYDHDGSGKLIQEHLALAVYPIDSRGNIGVQVRVATTLLKEERPESQHTVQLEIITSYESLARFSRGMKALVVGSIDEVLLRGESLT